VEESALNPHRAPNPEALARLYGEHQLGAALSRYSTDTLRASARDASLHISERATREEVVSRLTAYGTHGHYSADYAGRGEVSGAGGGTRGGSRGGTPHASGDDESWRAALAPVLSERSADDEGGEG
jgi:hypothetical protein